MPPRQPPAPPPERHPLQEFGQLEPQVQPDNLWALPLDHAQAEAPVDLDTPAAAAAADSAMRDEPDEDFDAAAAAVLRRDDPLGTRAGVDPRDRRAGVLAARHHRRRGKRSRRAVSFDRRRAAARSRGSGAAQDHRPHRPALDAAIERAAGGAARRALRGGAGRSAGQALHRHRAVADRDAAGDVRAARRSSRCAPTYRCPSAT